MFFILLVMELAVSFSASAEIIYSHNFNNQNFKNPTSINSNITGAWTSTGGNLYFFSHSSYAAALLGHNHTYILTLTMAERRQAEITSISFKRFSSDGATFQIKVDGENYGGSFTSSTDFINITRTKTESKLRNKVTIAISVTNSDTHNQNYSAIDDLVINGSVSSYDPADEAAPNPDGVLFVDKTVSTPGTGSTWNSALKEVSYALRAAQLNANIKQIWVARAEYKPEAAGEFFALKNGVKVYGGFSGSEEQVNDREPTSNKTVLSGNGSSVIKNSNIDNTALLDGFYISGGLGFPSGSTSSGAGIYNANSSPTIVNCFFKGNETDNTKVTGLGGGIYNVNSSPIITQCIFVGNKAKGTSQGYGGAIYNDNSSPVITNCTFSGNEVAGSSSTGNGGAICNANASSPTVLNSIIWNNPDASFSGSVSGISNTSTFTGAPVISYSLIQGGYPGMDHSIDADPKFTDSANNVYTLNNDSPGINAGSPATNLTIFPVNGDDQPIEFEGNKRVENNVIDLGIYEVKLPVIYRVSAASAAANPDGSTWPSAFPTLQQALSIVTPDDQIWVAKGEYQPNPDESFSMVKGVKIYGSFNGSETTFEERPNPLPKGTAPGVSILKGNGMSVIHNNYNNLTNNDILDGFTITGGQASQGGGIYNEGSSPTISNCTFKDNVAEEGGGGIMNYYASVKIENCTFSGNKSLSGQGGGVLAYANEMGIYNCVFYNNEANEGGAIYSNNCSPYILNSTFSNNTAGTGGAVFNHESYMLMMNSILYGNSSGIYNNNSEAYVSNSLVQEMGANTEYENLSGTTNPQFTNPAMSDFSLTSCSPAVNRGSESALQYFPNNPKDVTGIDRVFNGQVDMGAYELQSIPGPGGMPLDGESVVLPVFAGVTSFPKDCKTLALIEPTGSESWFQQYVTAKMYVASGQTLVAGNKHFLTRHVDLTPTDTQEEATAKITLFFTQQEFDNYNAAYGNAHNASLPANLKIVQYHGTSASGLPETYSGSTVVITDVTVEAIEGNTIWKVTFPITGFSGFFVSGQSEGALPVKLSYFKATKRESQASLDWQTVSEVTSSAFEIEHSLDGKKWYQIGTVSAKGESSVSIDYNFIHTQPASGENLYRLKMIDTDGSFAYSRISSLQFGENTLFAIFPNPAVEELHFTADIGKTLVGINLFDSNGRLVLHQEYISNKLSVGSLGAGIYIVEIKTNDGQLHRQRFVKQ